MGIPENAEGVVEVQKSSLHGAGFAKVMPVQTVAYSAYAELKQKYTIGRWEQHGDFLYFATKSLYLSDPTDRNGDLIPFFERYKTRIRKAQGDLSNKQIDGTRP